MKYQYTSVVLVLAMLFIVACGSEPAPSAPAATPEPTPVAAPEPVAVPAVAEPVAIEPTEPESTFSSADQSAITRWTAACKNGNGALCATLKTKYNIVVSPDKKMAKEEMAPEMAEEDMTEGSG